MDPVSAIANAIGSIFSSGFGFGKSKQEKELALIQLEAMTQPTYIDHFSNDDSDMELYTMIILAIIIIVLIFSFVYLNKK